MGFAKRARLTAALPDASEPPPAADLSTICIVRRDKRPAPVIALADSRTASEDTAKSATDGMFYKKGNATASTFRPAYWTYEPTSGNVAGPVASLERQLDARRRPQPVAPAPLEEKPLASLGAASASRKVAAAAGDDSTPIFDQPLPPRSPTVQPPLDTRTVLELLEPNSGAAEARGEPVPAPREPVSARPAVVETRPILLTTEELPSPIPARIVPEATPDLARDRPQDDAPLAAAASAPVEVLEETGLVPTPVSADSSSPRPRASEAREVDAGEAHREPVPAPREPAPARPALVEAVPTLPATEELPAPVPTSVISEPTPAPAKDRPQDDAPIAAVASAPVEVPERKSLAPTSAPAHSSPPSPRATEAKGVIGEAQIDGETHGERRELPVRKRPAREAATHVTPENADVLDSLGATIDSVLASRWYGSDRPASYSGRVLRSEAIAPVTPSGLIAELATVQKQETGAPSPQRRGGRILAAFCLVAIFAAALFATLLWRGGHGPHFAPRILPAIFGALPLPEPERGIADGLAAGRVTKAATFSLA